MTRVVDDIDRPDPSVVAELGAFPTAILSDVMTENRAMASDVKPISSALPRLVGTAVTIETPPGDSLAVHRAVKLAEPGDVLVVAGHEYADAAIWGDLLSKSATANGIEGTVTDSAVRDVSDTETADYPVFARYVTPRSGGKDRFGSINTTISCAGAIVEPGDVVVGDRDGVVVVPMDDADEVLQAARDATEKEQELEEKVNAGEYLYDLFDLQEKE